ncbi:murein biosynthesis integral membrane protein MurJ [Candidatus Gottesmanbacteria bacterium RBG_13_45_10]|uniref:Probable lipid II flippase MurJ n=1 Tax=Candidatus Gottesmanbacteria bacterium RBG_13_45_10 TaxID=1798370 RepID=A0A1F5ZH43_9BACT|nr:MAG: murein biosynthesis integral membrane protein MurJ [Candidatus Gottesmanbacteria bacterium RBG_13_45_10]
MKRVLDFMGRKQNSVGSAAFVLMCMVFASRVLGLVRDRLLSGRFVPDELGIYFAAFRLPNLIFELLVMGALTSAFIPVFTRYLTEGKQKEGWHMASIVINISIVILGVMSLPILIWTDEFSRFLAPGFTDSQIHQMATFSRFMVLFQVLPLLVGNFFTGILQSYNLFLMPALAPVVYNVGIIIGIVALSSSLGLYAPVVGVGIGAVLFMLIQLPVLLRIGYRHDFAFNYRNKGVQEVGKLIGPRTLGLAVSQIDSTVDLMMSSLLGARMVTIFNFAQNLQQLPVGLFGATVAQAALPTLSVASVKEDKDQFKKSIIRAIHQILFFVLPSSVFFIVLRIPIVRLVFGASRFDWQATYLTGMTLFMFSLSLFAQSTVHVLARGFYALYDTKTPVVVSIISIVVNSVASVFFIWVAHLPVWSLGLSTSIASILNALVLYVLLDRRIGRFPKGELFMPPIKMLIASAIAGLSIYIPLKLLDQLVFDTTRTFGLILLTGIAGGAGLTAYVFLAWVFGVGEVKSFIALIRRVRRPQAVILEPANEVINGGIEDKFS